MRNEFRTEVQRSLLVYIFEEQRSNKSIHNSIPFVLYKFNRKNCILKLITKYFLNPNYITHCEPNFLIQ